MVSLLLWLTPAFAQSSQKNASAQQQNTTTNVVRGYVCDENNVAMSGVVVRNLTSKKNAVTDKNGRFSVPCHGAGDRITLTFVGKRTIEATAELGNTMTFVMEDDEAVLDDVVVTGYQTIKRTNATGSFGFVDSKKLTQQIHKDLLSSLEGQVAGLRFDINPNTGESTPILRGVGTFSNNVGTQPLIVIDNIPTSMTLDEINPYDVESVTVLKDAAASSIYGALAANGVIVITTKQGKENGVRVNVNADWFISTKPNFKSMHYAETGDVIDFQTEMYKAAVAKAGGEDNYFTTPNYYNPLYQLYRDQHDGVISEADVNQKLAQWRNVNYYDQFRDNMWRSQLTQKYNVSMTSRTSRSNQYVSFNYQHDKNRMINDSNNAFGLYFKSSFNVKKWLTLNTGIDLRLSRAQSPEVSFSQESLDPYTAICDAQGNSVALPYGIYAGYAGTSVNGTVARTFAENPAFQSFDFSPLDILNENIEKARRARIRPFVSADFKFLNMFKYSFLYQYEWNDYKRELLSDKDSYMMRMAHNALIDANGVCHLPDGARYNQFNSSSKRYTLRNQLSFDKTFNGGHTINAATGLEFRESHTPPSMEERIYGYNPRSLSGSRMDWETMATTGIESLMTGTTVRLMSPSVTKTDVKHRYASYYLTANYTYKYKYNASASIRWDEADLFGLDTREQKHPLWSLGAGWTLSEESFMKGTASWLSYLKLRASYGVNGNVDQASTTYFVAKYKKMSTSLQPLGQGLTYLDYDGDDLPNPKLRWEKTATTNIGLDFRLFKNLIRGNIEYYNRHGSDLLVRRFMDSTLGTDSRVVNNGEIRNRGLEVSITGNIINTEDWNFSVTLTHAINSNKVIAVDEDPNWVASNYITSPTNYFKKGTSFNTLWAYRMGRVVNGYPVILDADGNEMVQFDENGNVKELTHSSTLKGTDALVNMGTITPKYNGSLGLNLRYKEFELNALFVYAGGNKLRLDVADLAESGYTMRSTHILDRWTTANKEGVRMYLDMDEVGRQYASDFAYWWKYSDQQVKDANYIKLRSISLAYNLPRTLCKTLHLSNLRLTLQTNNLFYWSKVGKDIDPESYSLGSGSRVVNQPRTFAIGLSTSF
jgi:TonB-linked SusC/RagA family outer membrane protein